ncbi:unnamed protein product [Ixodes persulcatus]
MRPADCVFEIYGLSDMRYPQRFASSVQASNPGHLERGIHGPLPASMAQSSGV